MAPVEMAKEVKYVIGMKRAHSVELLASETRFAST